jgi:pimeloyl-ACP methyl ester carboxylesterase
VYAVIFIDAIQVKIREGQVGFTTFPGEVWAAPRSWVEHSYPSLTYFNEVDKGGHFAAWEEPELFANEVRAAFRFASTPAGFGG